MIVGGARAEIFRLDFFFPRMFMVGKFFSRMFMVGNFFSRGVAC